MGRLDPRSPSLTGKRITCFSFYCSLTASHAVLHRRERHPDGHSEEVVCRREPPARFCLPAKRSLRFACACAPKGRLENPWKLKEMPREVFKGLGNLSGGPGCHGLDIPWGRGEGQERLGLLIWLAYWFRRIAVTDKTTEASPLKDLSRGVGRALTPLTAPGRICPMPSSSFPKRPASPGWWPPPSDLCLCRHTVCSLCLHITFPLCVCLLVQGH